MPTARPPSVACAAVQESGPGDFGFERGEPRGRSFELAIDACGGGADLRYGPVRMPASGEFGKAAWYDFVGGKTASGEILDTVTATAAHRSLPLASFAKVTDIDNGRSVIVKINDRGPYTRGRIIDLSPRAADALDMKSAGVANVVIEPLMNHAVSTVAAFLSLDMMAVP